MTAIVEKIIPSGNSFIDENHMGLLEHLSSISENISEDWNPQRIRETLREFTLDIENHFSHEDTILRGANFSNLDRHIISHTKIAMALHEKINDDFDLDDIKQFIKNIGADIFSHEIMDDQEYWYLFVDKLRNDELLLRWKSEYSTGSMELDKQHLALVNHINRFYLNIVQNDDVDAAVKELKLIEIYSAYHFEEEEKILGDKSCRAHKANHEKLLADLDNLRTELVQGKFSVANLPDYLDYWLFNHIREFDIPASHTDQA